MLLVDVSGVIVDEFEDRRHLSGFVFAPIRSQKMPRGKNFFPQHL